jgi:hypothetical protein
VTPTLLTPQLCVDGFGSDVTELIFYADPICDSEDQKNFLIQGIEITSTIKTISLRGGAFVGIKELSTFLVTPTCQITTLIVSGINQNIHLDEEISEILSDVLASNQSITTLKFENREASSKTIRTIFSYLKTSVILQRLSFQGTSFFGEDSENLADSLANNMSLRELNLSYCSLEDIECLRIADALKTHKTLRLLDLSHNLFSAKGLGRAYMMLYEGMPDCTGHEAIKEMLLVNDVLEELNLEGCDTGSVDVRHICEALERNKSLTALHLEPAKYCKEERKLIKKNVRRNLMSKSQYHAAIVLHNILRSTMDLLPEIWIEILSYVFTAMDNFQEFALAVCKLYHK